MQNLIISILSWPYIQIGLLLMAYTILFSAHIIQIKDINRQLSTLKETLGRLTESSQHVAEVVKLQQNDYRPVSECAGEQSTHQIREMSPRQMSNCWRSLLHVSGGDTQIARDLSGLLIEELPDIINQLESISEVTPIEADLFHQWQGLFRCCGLDRVAEQFKSFTQSPRTKFVVLNPARKEQILEELRALLVETFHLLRQFDHDHCRPPNIQIKSVKQSVSLGNDCR